MKPIVITIPSNAMSQGKEEQFAGYLVPDTNDTLAIDMRYEADLNAIPPQPASWAITHLPTGFRVRYGDYTRAGCMDDAMHIAKRFFIEATALGANLGSTDPAEVTGPIGALGKEAMKQFWRKVANWPEPESLSGGEQHGR